MFDLSLWRGEGAAGEGNVACGGCEKRMVCVGRIPSSVVKRCSLFIFIFMRSSHLSVPLPGLRLTGTVTVFSTAGIPQRRAGPGTGPRREATGRERVGEVSVATCFGSNGISPSERGGGT